MGIDWTAVSAWDVWTWPLWEPLRNWLVAIGGLIALIVAVRTYASNARVRREEQARKVYSRSYATQVLPKGKRVSHIYLFDSIGVEPAETEYPDGDQVFRLLHDHTTHHVQVHNRSEEIVGPLRLRVALDDTPAGPICATEWIDVAEPKSVWEVEFLIPECEHSREPLAIEVLFRDSSGRWWSRLDAYPVERRRWLWFASPTRERSDLTRSA